MRDDFTQKIIERLRARVNNRCSNPDCRVPTTGPTTDPESITSIGVAAHITAAAPGGPRYDVSCDAEERKSILNAIWLCSNCSIMIDRDPDAYTIEKLKKWKKIVEAKAADEIGKKMPDDDYVIQSLTSAMSGQSATYLSNIIANSCKATTKSLEKLDPRFLVKASHKNDFTSYELIARENISTTFKINPKYSKAFLEKFIKLQDHGEALIIDGNAIEIEGSPLLEHIFDSESGRFEFSPQRIKNCIQKVWLQNNDSTESFQFYDIHGEAVLGKASMTFTGEALEGLVASNFRFPLYTTLEDNVDLSFKINFEKWNEKNIFYLPYFEQIYDFFCKIKEGFIFYSSLEIEGKKILSGISKNFSENEYFKYIYSHFHYIHLVRKICSLLRTSITYNDGYEYSIDEHIQMDDIYKTLSEGIHIRRDSIKVNPKCTLEVNEDLLNLRAIHEATGSRTIFRFEETEPGEIDPFFQRLVLPRLIYTFVGVTPVIKEDIFNLKPGDLVEIEWEPTDDFQYKIERM